MDENGIGGGCSPLDSHDKESGLKKWLPYLRRMCRLKVDCGNATALVIWEHQCHGSQFRWGWACRVGILLVESVGVFQKVAVSLWTGHKDNNIPTTFS